MKVVLVLCAAVLAVCARPENQYTNKYDNVELDDILANRRLLVPYVLCTLDQGKCTPDGRELKSHIHEALENYCAKCTETQRAGTRRVIAHLIKHEPEFWRQVSAKYDRDGHYAAKYEAELRAIV